MQEAQIRRSPPSRPDRRRHRDLIAERRRGLRVVAVAIGAFVALFLAIWVWLVLPLYFESPHPVSLPGENGNSASFPASQYALAEAAGTAVFLAPSIFFVAVGVWVYRRAQRDIRQLEKAGSGQTESP
ncbi:MAG TPA: hypothetical protein VMH78_01700 [Thermoplasmata archaeon]|nr:hypothetical protein [Thermoplasmata archaeon]